MRPTRHDPSLRWTQTAIAHLTAAQDARNRYDTLLTEAIEIFGDRHTPVRSGGVLSQCRVCSDRGLIHTAQESLNHQTGSLISGIYADHFPRITQSALRTYARLITEHTDSAFMCWRKAGRTRRTMRDIVAPDYRKLTDGRVSYY